MDPDDWKCPLCLDLSYKPTVNSLCGHTFCFWCIHKVTFHGRRVHHDGTLCRGDRSGRAERGLTSPSVPMSAANRPRSLPTTTFDGGGGTGVPQPCQPPCLRPPAGLCRPLAASQQAATDPPLPSPSRPLLLQAMSPYTPSTCPVCRTKYGNFPAVGCA